MKYITFILFLTCSILVNSQEVSTHSRKDVKFARTAAESGLMEIKLGELAQTNAVTPEVKSHAIMMIDDHNKINAELNDIATKKHIALPTSISTKKQEKYNKLAKLEGKEFDKKYAKCMVKNHKKAICLFKKESKRGNDPELKTWAAEKLPRLRNHLQMWKSSCKNLKK